MFDIEDVGVFLGLDVGKTRPPRPRADPGREEGLRQAAAQQRAEAAGRVRQAQGQVTAPSWSIVDQPASIGALPLTVARDAGCLVAYLPGLAMRRIADLYPGEAKTDAQDAASSRTPPARCRTPCASLELTDETTAELHSADRLRPGPRRRSHPHQQPDTRPAHPVPPQPRTRPRPAPRPPRRHWLLERYGSPAALRKAGRSRLVELIRPKAPRMAARLIDDVFDALDEQTVVVPGTGTARRSSSRPGRLPRPPSTPSAGLWKPRSRACWRPTLFHQVLTSMPGVGVRTAAVLLATVGDGTGFPTAAHLASYAGLAPATRRSGTSIHGEHAPRGGNRQLKRAMFLSAFACMNADPASRDLLRQATSPRQNPHPSPPPPRPPAHQRPVRHAPRRHLLRIPHAHGRRPRRMTPAKPHHPKPDGALTKDIEATPGATPCGWTPARCATRPKTRSCAPGCCTPTAWLPRCAPTCAPRQRLSA